MEWSNKTDVKFSVKSIKYKSGVLAQKETCTATTSFHYQQERHKKTYINGITSY